MLKNKFLPILIFSAIMFLASVWFAQAADTIKPSIVEGLAKVSNTPTQVVISWTPATDNVGVVSYTIYRNGSAVGTSLTNSYVDSNVAPSTVYIYRLRAHDAAGNFSNSQSIPFLLATPYTPTVPGAADGGTSVYAITPTKLFFSWSTSEDDTAVAGYRVYRNGTEIATVPVPGYIDENVTVSTAYTYRAAAFDADGNLSAQSFPATITTPSGQPGSILYVDQPPAESGSGWNGVNGGAYSGVPGAGKGYSTIQAALNAAKSGDDIYIRSGTYQEGNITMPLTTSGTENDWSSIQSYPGEWAVIDGQNDLVLPGPDARTFCLGYPGGKSFNEELHYWKIERLEIKNCRQHESLPETAGKATAVGLYVNGGPFKIRYMYIHDNAVSGNDTSVSGGICGNNPSGFRSYRMHDSVMEYNYFKNNGGPAQEGNCAQVSIFFDYKTEKDQVDDVNHAIRKNEYQYNYFENSFVGFRDKGFQYLTNRAGVDMQHKDYGDKIHHNIFSGVQRAIENGQDFAQIYNNIIEDSTVFTDGANNRWIGRYINFYNNSFVGGGYLYHPLSVDVPPPVFNPYFWAVNNILDRPDTDWDKGHFNIGQYRPDLITNQEMIMTDSKIDCNFIHSPTSNNHYLLGSNSENSALGYLTTAEINSFHGFSNYTNSSAGLFQGTLGSLRYKTVGAFFLGNGKTITDGGLGGSHPYLNGVTFPSYVGAVNPNDNAWVDGVLGLATLNNLQNGSSGDASWIEGAGASNDSQAPTVPTGLSATTASSSQINLSWAASTDNIAVTGYKIYRNGTQVGTSPTNSYNDKGLSPSTLYSYSVSAYDAANNNSVQTSAVSTTTLVADLTPPTGSININSGVFYTNNILTTLTLLAADISGVTQMVISNTNVFDSLAAVAFSSSLSWTLSAVDGIRTVYVWFKDALGNWNTTPFTDTITLDRAAADITNIALTNISANSATLTWTTSESAVSYIDYGLTSAYGQTTVEETSYVTVHTLALSSLSASTTYNFRVNASDRAGNPSFSINQTFETASSSGPDIIPPAKITNLSSNNILETSGYLQWTATGDDNQTGLAKSYELRYSTAVIADNSSQLDSWWNSAAPVTQTMTPKTSGQAEIFHVLGLTAQTTYYFALKAIDEANNPSPISNIAILTTPTGTVVNPPPPSGGGGGSSGGGGGGGSSGGGSSGSGTITNPNGTEAPTNFIAIGAKDQIYLQWVNPINSTFSGVKLYRKSGSAITGQTDTQGKLVYEGTREQFTDSNLITGNKYFYTIYAYDRDLKYSLPKIVSATLDQTKETIVLPQAETAPANSTASEQNKQSQKISLIGVKSSEVETITKAESQALREDAVNVPLSATTLPIYKKIIALATKEISQDNKYALASFIHYGTPTTVIIGAGERGGSIASFRSAFGKLPETEIDWQDVIKIANGRWPTQRNTSAQYRAQGGAFVQIYGRSADLNNQNDNAAVTVMTYGLRPAQRNTNSEKTAILSFKYIFKKNPTSAADWDIVRAIAYSGARR